MLHLVCHSLHGHAAVDIACTLLTPVSDHWRSCVYFCWVASRSNVAGIVKTGYCACQLTFTAKRATEFTTRCIDARAPSSQFQLIVTSVLFQPFPLATGDCTGLATVHLIYLHRVACVANIANQVTTRSCKRQFAFAAGCAAGCAIGCIDTRTTVCPIPFTVTSLLFQPHWLQAIVLALQPERHFPN